MGVCWSLYAWRKTPRTSFSNFIFLFFYNVLTIPDFVVINSKTSAISCHAHTNMHAYSCNSHLTDERCLLALCPAIIFLFQAGVDIYYDAIILLSLLQSDFALHKVFILTHNYTQHKFTVKHCQADYDC